MDARTTRRLAAATIVGLMLGCLVAAGPASAAGVGHPAAGVGSRIVQAAPKVPPSRSYVCTKLISLAQFRKLTGLKDATMVRQSQSGRLPGQTYCQFLARQGAAAIAISVWTGPSRKSFDALWASGAGAELLSGIGDQARISVPYATGGAYVRGTGISVKMDETGTDGLKGVNVRAALRSLLATLAKKV